MKSREGKKPILPIHFIATEAGLSECINYLTEELLEYFL